MKRLIAITSAIVVASSAMMAQNTTKLTADKSNEYGIIFSLPVTHLKIEVLAKKTVYKAGPYYKYAQKYLGVSDVITKDSQKWDISEVYVTPFGMPDSTKYLMKFKSGSAPFLLLDEQGLPLAVNKMVEPVMPQQRKLPANSKPSILEGNAYMSSLPGELLVSESTAKKAEIAASLIYKIRESRTNLITGEAEQMPPDGAAMKLTMENLDEQEAALTALFVGTTTTSYSLKSLDYLPGDEVTNFVIARVSNQKGIVDKDDLSGAPLYLTLRVLERGELPRNDKGEPKKLPKEAVMYKVPGKAEISLRFNGREVFVNRFEIAQYGMDFGVEPGLFTDKKAPFYMIYYPETGAVKELRAISE